MNRPFGTLIVAAAVLALGGCKLPSTPPSQESIDQSAATGQTTLQLSQAIQSQAASTGVGGNAGSLNAPFMRALAVTAGSCPIVTYSNTCTTAAAGSSCAISFDADYGTGCPNDPADHKGEVGSVLNRTGGSPNGTLNFHATRYSEGPNRTLDGTATVAVTVSGGDGSLQIQASNVTATDPTTGEVLTFTFDVLLDVAFNPSAPTMAVVTIKTGSTARSTSSKGGNVSVTVTSDVVFNPTLCATEPLQGSMDLSGTDSAGKSFSGWTIDFADGACDEQAIVKSGDFTVHVKFHN